MLPVVRISRAMRSKWSSVIRSLSLNTTRQITIRVTTIAIPEKMAPATK